MPKPNEIIVTGILIPVEWEDDGTPKALALAAPGEMEYLIPKDQKRMAELIPFLSQNLRVRGTLQPSDTRRLVLQVTHVEKI